MTSRLPILLAALLFAVYAQHVWTAGFVYEDGRHLKAALDGPIWAFQRPLMSFSLWLQLEYTPWVFAFHAANVFLHGCVGLLAGVLASRLGLSLAGAYLTAALVLVHPLNVEAVAYLSARPELFAAIGVLSACVLALSETRWRWPLVALAVAFGLAGKESAIVAIGLIPLTLWGTGRSWKTVAVVGMALLAASAAFIGPARLVNIGEAVNLTVSWSDWLLAQSAAAFQLIGLTLLPLGLSIDHDVDILPLAARLIALVGLAGIVIVAYRYRRTRSLVTFGLVWTLLAILPRLIIQTPKSNFNEHQFYIPTMGLIVAGVAWWDGSGSNCPV